MKHGSSFSRPWFSNMSDCLGIFNEFDHMYRSNRIDDDPSYSRNSAMLEGGAREENSDCPSQSQNRRQVLGSNSDPTDDIWRDLIIPISQNVYKQIGRAHV